MKQLFMVVSGLLLAINAEANYFQLALNDNYSLVSIQTDTRLQDTAGLYAIDISHQGKTIGLVKEIRFGSSWRGSFGLLLADEDISISTARSPVRIFNRLIDLNELFAVKARLEFADLIPYASLAYQYENDSREITVDFVTGLKLLKLDENDIIFEQALGEMVEQYNDISSRLKEDAFNRLEEYYLQPVFHVKIQFHF